MLTPPMPHVGSNRGRFDPHGLAWEPHLRGSLRFDFVSTSHLEFASSVRVWRVAQPTRTCRSFQRKVARCTHPWHSASNSRPSASPIAAEALRCSSASALSYRRCTEELHLPRCLMRRSAFTTPKAAAKSVAPPMRKDLPPNWALSSPSAAGCGLCATEYDAHGVAMKTTSNSRRRTRRSSASPTSLRGTRRAAPRPVSCRPP